MVLSKTVAENAEVGRTGILDAAALLLGRQGYGAVSLRMIAEAAGIKAGSIYYHFTASPSSVGWSIGAFGFGTSCHWRSS